MLTRFRSIGSLKIAVLLLVALAGILAWGTIYETRFGTAAVQRFVYQAWWFQMLLAFLAVNLTVAALRRYPWRRKHVPFALAHLGIILVLLGGILGGRFGIDGQMVISEGQMSSILQLPFNVLAVHQPNPGVTQEFRTNFETTAWNNRPNALFEVATKGGRIQLAVDRYYPNAERHEEITDEGESNNPALHVEFLHDADKSQDVWLFARDPGRFGARSGDMHLFFFEPTSGLQLAQLLSDEKPDPSDRGVVQFEFQDLGLKREIPVPSDVHKAFPIEGTPYAVTFKEYYADFALTEQGMTSRSDRPNNPAVNLTLAGPEGTDSYILFALHPDFSAMHGRTHKIHARVTYHHAGASRLPAGSIALVLRPSGRMAAVLTGQDGQRRKIDPVEFGKLYALPSGCCRFKLTAFYPRAKRIEQFVNRDDRVRSETLHLTARYGGRTDQAWLSSGEAVLLDLGGKEPIQVEYRPAQRELPFSVKLLDFRKIDYPGTEMAAGFESDVEIADPKAGFTLTRKISMNNPLKYRGFTFFQSGYLQGPAQTTVLSVRSDPGTPFVYAGFLVVILGVAAMFLLKRGTRTAAGS